MKRALLLIGVLMFTFGEPCNAEVSSIPVISEYSLPAVVSVQAGDSTGSGFFISPSGYLLTSSHVVKDNTNVTIKLFDGKLLDADVIGQGPTDIALLRVNKVGMPSLRIGSSEQTKQGETIVALGSPKGLPNSVSRGIVSHQSREIGGIRYIQIDALINPGNSGGPIINSKGEVIGIATSIMKDAQGIGFVLPIENSFPLITSNNVPANTAFINAAIALQPIPLTVAPGPSERDSAYRIYGAVVAVIIMLSAGIFLWMRRRAKKHKESKQDTAIANEIEPQTDIPVILKPQDKEEDIEIDLK